MLCDLMISTEVNTAKVLRWIGSTN